LEKTYPRVVIPNRGAAKYRIMSLFLYFTAKGTSYYHFLACWGAANFFEVLKGAVNLKRLKNTVLEERKEQNKKP